MRVAYDNLLTFFPLALASCLGLDLGQSGSDAGAAATGSGTSDAGDAAPGTGCVIDPNSGSTLCRGIAICPGLLVDGDQFPDCGFRLQGTAVDLECSCSGALCPMGTTTTCAQASALLTTQTELGVCTQVSEGRCAAPSNPAAPAASTPTGTCDKNCASECSGAPSCLELCGC